MGPAAPGPRIPAGPHRVPTGQPRAADAERIALTEKGHGEPQRVLRDLEFWQRLREWRPPASPRKAALSAARDVSAEDGGAAGAVHLHVHVAAGQDRRVHARAGAPRAVLHGADLP